MNPHSLPSILRRRTLVALAVFFLLSLVLVFGFAVSGARHQRGDAATSAPGERKFEDAIPGHVPVKVKLKSEKSFKDLKNKGWARELEVEVKNTGSKPIYYLYVVLVMPDVLVNGHPLSMRTTLGRKELGLPETPVGPDDVPVLLPGQSLTIKIPENKVRAYETSRDQAGRPDPKTVEFEVQAVKFGDGTGFRGRAGKEWQESKEKETPRPPHLGARSRRV